MMNRGTHGLRRRCPRCKHLRRFYEPPGDQGDHRPARAKWVKVGNFWVCRPCVDKERQSLYENPRVAALVQAGIKSALRGPMRLLEEVLDELGVLPARPRGKAPRVVFAEVVRAFNLELGGCVTAHVVQSKTTNCVTWGIHLRSLALPNYRHGLDFAVFQTPRKAYPCRSHVEAKTGFIPDEAALRKFLENQLTSEQTREVITRM